MLEQWKGFSSGKWTQEINVRDFIQKNYTPYEGDESFLASPTEQTYKLWQQVTELMKQEREKGILDTDTKVVSTITSHAPGYIDKDLEKIVGLQTDKPLKRAIMPLGGIRVVKSSLQAYGYQLDPQTEEIFTKYRKTHNDGVFDGYTREMRLARRSGIITGLPDAYGRGRIIGDYRRVALYGVDRLIGDKKEAAGIAGS
jgi:formate C-acetyltransferase